MSLADLEFCELAPDFDLSLFDCGQQDLNDFLCNDSFNYQDQLIAKTFLFHENHVLIAFFSISNDTLTDKGHTSVWNRLSRKIPNSKRRKIYPGVKIGRLGVSNQIQSSGLGTEIIDFIKGLVLFHSKSACRFLIVDAYNNERTINFYTKNKFQFLIGDADKENETRSMFLDLLPFWKTLADNTQD